MPLDYLENRNKLVSHFTHINQKVVVGIDEAGRGPVIGYMVYAAFVLPINLTDNLNLQDSKKLTALSRTKTFNELSSYSYIYNAVHPDYISYNMLKKTKNLNEIAMEATFKLLDHLKKENYDVLHVYVDALGDCGKYKKILEKKYALKFTVEEKADSKYRVVSGASIVAKVIRDELLGEFGKDLGSGYPGDPVTKKWLVKNFDPVFGFPAGVRYSWITVTRMLGERKSKPVSKKLSNFYFCPY